MCVMLIVFTVGAGLAMSIVYVCFRMEHVALVVIAGTTVLISCLKLKSL